MANKVGALIREARTGAGLTQEQLAKKIEGLTAADISKAERGEKELSQARLKEIAKATGVTQSSLLNAAKEDAAGKTATAAKTASGKTGTSSGKKTGTASDSGLTAAEKKLLEAYRAAGADAKKNALKILKGEDLEMADIMKLLKLDSKLENLDANGLLGGLKESLLGGLLGKK